MRGPQGQKVEVANLSASFPTPEFDAARVLLSDRITGKHLTMRIAGKTGVAMSSVKKAGAVLIDHGNLWMISATGPDAKRLLKHVASTVTLAR